MLGMFVHFIFMCHVTDFHPSVFQMVRSHFCPAPTLSSSQTTYRLPASGGREDRRTGHEPLDATRPRSLDTTYRVPANGGGSWLGHSSHSTSLCLATLFSHPRLQREAPYASTSPIPYSSHVPALMANGGVTRTHKRLLGHPFLNFT